MKSPSYIGMHFGAPPKIFKNARILRGKMTAEESLLWDYLKTKPYGYKFRRQHPCGLYILDFYCHHIRLSIEIDGDYHLKQEQIVKDLERTQFINDCGIKEIRFTNDDINNNMRRVAEVINFELMPNTPLGAGGETNSKQ
ncbi:endonuclease domain-containing protein [Winogradskyella maritima]|uniref:Endonuclease domain-containing protein n=1 Tax=Winogradskyella maritima TaxID=1517766 RepID=A0ABV8AJY3_9FLAO|nr:endonuclease domain-containing protein [Winogradskyella maritima]